MYYRYNTLWRPSCCRSFSTTSPTTSLLSSTFFSLVYRVSHSHSYFYCCCYPPISFLVDLSIFFRAAVPPRMTFANSPPFSWHVGGSADFLPWLRSVYFQNRKLPLFSLLIGRCAVEDNIGGLLLQMWQRFLNHRLSFSSSLFT